jgi:hypothetical protein
MFLFSFTSMGAAYDIAHASTADGTISTDAYAWGENIGWINFGCANCNVHVTDAGLTGDAWSAQYGWINLAPTNGGVTNDSEGHLGGTAWSSGLGWISFSGVTINSSGKFTGIAGNAASTSGRINFSCTNCSVITDWRPLSVRNATSSTNTGTSTTVSQTGGTSSYGSYYGTRTIYASGVNPIEISSTTYAYLQKYILNNQSLSTSTQVNNSSFTPFINIFGGTEPSVNTVKAGSSTNNSASTSNARINYINNIINLPVTNPLLVLLLVIIGLAISTIIFLRSI